MFVQYNQCFDTNQRDRMFVCLGSIIVISGKILIISGRVFTIYSQC